MNNLPLAEQLYIDVCNMVETEASPLDIHELALARVKEAVDLLRLALADEEIAAKYFGDDFSLERAEWLISEYDIPKRGRPTMEFGAHQVQRTVNLAEDYVEKAREIGQGNISEGIRRALNAY